MTTPPPTIVIETHGCKLNQADSEALARRFVLAGCRVARPGEAADVYVVNTCTVTHQADADARKALRAARRRHPRAVLVAAGCYAQRAPAELARLGVDLVVGNREKHALVEQVLGVLGAAPVPCATGAEPLAPGLLGRTRAFVKVQEGCNQVCAYCIVPRVRGRERSVPPDELVRQVQERVAGGYQEAVLTGTQLGTYGFDLPGASLEGLVRRVLEETAVPRLRVSSLQPQEVTEGLLHLWQEFPQRLCPHFHLPLQSGSDAVLRRMRRRYTTAQYRDAVARIREAVPDAAVTCDLIVGFPGETEEDFEAGLALGREAMLAGMHVFPYSVRPGTSAAHFQPRVEEGVKERRMARALALGRELAVAFRRRSLGQVRPVLWEGVKLSQGRPAWTGLTDTYLRVYLPSPQAVAAPITPVRLVAEAEDGLLGEVVG